MRPLYVAGSHIRFVVRSSKPTRSFIASIAHPSRSNFRMASTLPNSAIFKTLAQHNPQNLAIIHSRSGRSFTYGSLIHDVAVSKDILWERGGKKSLKGERIAFLAENGYDYVGMLSSMCQ